MILGCFFLMVKLPAKWFIVHVEENDKSNLLFIKHLNCEMYFFFMCVK